VKQSILPSRPAAAAVAAAGGLEVQMSELVRVVTADRFDREVLQAEGLVLVDFLATWCPPCRRLAPTLDAVAADYDGRLTVAKVDVDENPELAQRYGVQSIPTLILFRDGKPVDKRLGALPNDDLRQFVDGRLAAPAVA
jgi:thioredoxin 1